MSYWSLVSNLFKYWRKSLQIVYILWNLHWFEALVYYQQQHKIWKIKQRKVKKSNRHSKERINNLMVSTRTSDNQFFFFFCCSFMLLVYLAIFVQLACCILLDRKSIAYCQMGSYFIHNIENGKMFVWYEVLIKMLA